jgi:dTMP kinase
VRTKALATAKSNASPNSGNKFIVIEGIDGVGKTTLAKSLAENIRRRGIPVSLTTGLAAPFSRIRTPIREIDDVRVRYLFYLASNCLVSETIKQLLKDQWVICVRYVYSTQAYHVARGLRDAIPLASLHLAMPDHAFLITLADNMLRKRRLAGRLVQSRDDMASKAVTRRIEDLYREFDLVEIDNSASGTGSAVQAMLRLIFDSPIGK